MPLTIATRTTRSFAALALCACVITPANAEPVFKTLYRFKGGLDGALPLGPLVADKDGKLYGVTFKGGIDDKGTVFMLTPPVPPATAWKKTVLHFFAGRPADGKGPMTGLTMHRGRLYGTTFYDGPFGSGTIFRLSPPRSTNASWSYETVHNFTDMPNGYSPISRVVFDDDGALYGFTYGGGSPGSGPTFYKVTPDGQLPWPVSVLKTFSNASDGSPIIAGSAGMPIRYSSGTFITTSWTGGTNNWGTVFQIYPEDGRLQIIHDFRFTGEGGRPQHGVVSDDAGVLYGTTESGGAPAGGLVFKLTPPTLPSTTWTFSKLHELPSSPEHGSVYANGVVLNARGMLFGTAQYGGTHDVGYSFRLIPPADGEGPWRSSVLYSFRGGGDGARPGTLTLGRGGVLFGMTYDGGTACNCGTLFMIEP